MPSEPPCVRIPSAPAAQLTQAVSGLQQQHLLLMALALLPAWCFVLSWLMMLDDAWQVPPAHPPAQ